MHGFNNLNILPSDDYISFYNCGIFCFSESWLCDKITSLPNFFANYKVFDHPAKRNKTLGKASGGIGILVDPKIVKSLVIRTCCESFMSLNCFIDETEILVISVYLRNDFFTEDLENLVRFICDTLHQFKGVLILGGDFNSRIGSASQIEEEVVHGSHFHQKRNAMDDVVNKQGRLLVQELENLGLIVLNGRSISDRSGSLTFLGNKGSSTIDYIWTNN